MKAISLCVTALNSTAVKFNGAILSVTGPDNIILVTAITPYNFLWPINAVFVWLLPSSMLFWVRKVLNENSVYPRVDDRSENFETFFNKDKQQLNNKC